MQGLDNNCFATLEFDVLWKSDHARHRERYLGRKVNFWRDEFPPGFKDKLKGAGIGDEITMHYAPGEALPDYDDRLVKRLPAAAFRRTAFYGRVVSPRFGRFYPRGLINDLPSTFAGDIRPSRITGLENGHMSVDLNHPMAGRDFTLKATVQNLARKECDTGGRLSAWLEDILDYGPGMQAESPAGPTDFGLAAGFARADEAPDTEFYATSRLIGHIDRHAHEFLKQAYTEHLKPGMKVLDLMSSVESHLPEGMDLHVVGLGLNAEELNANPRLSEHLVHDLNTEPALPFQTAEFDAVVISLSVEYLTRPQEVIDEAVRVLKPGGKLLIGFSNRWFPPKVVNLWLDLHEFERLGLIQDRLLRTDSVGDLETLSIRNWWRPEDDPHIRETFVADPLYVVAATKM